MSVTIKSEHEIELMREAGRILSIVHQEMEKIKPELQDRILEIINSKKSVDDFASYVRCPKCYSRIYRSNTLISEPEDSTQIEKHKAARCTLGSLGDLINNN